MTSARVDPPLTNQDTVRVRDLLLLAHVADGAQWPSSTSAPVRQPVRVSISVPYDLRPAAEADDVSKSINYGTLSKCVLASVVEAEDHAPPAAAAATARQRQFRSLEQLSGHIFATCFAAFPEIERMTLDVVKPRALPYADGVRVLSSRARDGSRLAPERFSIQRLACNVLVGLNPCEREDKQLVCFDVEVPTTHHHPPPSSSSPVHSQDQSQTLDEDDAFDFRGLAKDIRQEVEASEFISLESLASLVARIALRHAVRSDDVVTVRAAKPKALVFADAAEVEIVRTSRDYPPAPSAEASAHASQSLGLDPPIGPSTLNLQVPDVRRNLPQGRHLVAIALGSNLGDRFANIEAALHLLEYPEFISTPQKAIASLRVINTSFLYETAPMYVTDQPSFLNCACIVRTDSPPRDILVLLKTIERTVGRVPSIRNGPRAVDLDILFYDDACIDSRPESLKGTLGGLEGQLVIPHPRMAEREFVLLPLSDMIPDFVHPVLRKPIHEMLSDVLKVSPVGSPAMIKVMPFPAYPHSPRNLPPPVANVPHIPHTQTYWKFPPSRSAVPSGRTAPARRTRLMATLNVTPDSFSDGSDHTALPAALSYATTCVAAGADIVDVGGYSTRPGAAFVTPADERDRVVPVIKGIRALQPPDTAGTKNMLISVDTFRPEVVRSAVHAGANCINDVHAFTGPDYPPSAVSAAAHFAEMRSTAGGLVVPVILMHSRGDAGQNKDYSGYGSVVQGVAQELGEKVEAIVRGPGGLRRWLVMVDPGIGFSKSLDGNLQLLRDASSITANERTLNGAWNPLRGYPQLIGVSRKSFLGNILSQPTEDGTYQGRQTTPKERGWATAAAVTSAVQQGAAVVRVHDVAELGDVVRVADSIWN